MAKVQNGEEILPEGRTDVTDRRICDSKYPNVT